MDILRDTPTKALLGAVVRSHLVGHVAIGIDTSPTGTGKTTSGSQFFNNLERFLEEVEHDHQLKVVIVASQHRYLGNYWTPHTHQRAIRFLGAEEYSRRLRELFNQPATAQDVVRSMVRDGLVPHHCPLLEEQVWLRSIGATAERKRITLKDYRNVCREHLQQKITEADAEQLFEACNHACPLAGGAFFDARPGGDVAEVPPTTVPDRARPRVALLTSAKFRYRAATFYLSHDDVKLRSVDFQDICNAVVVFEEAADVFEAMLGYVDEKAVSTELLSTSALIHELFNRRQFEHDWVRRKLEQTSTIYLGASKERIVHDGRWLPVNLYQTNAKRRSDYLLPVSRDRCALVMADYPRYTLQRRGDVIDAYSSFSLHIAGSDPAPPLPRTKIKAALADRFTPPNPTPAKVIPLTAPLVNLVRATFSRAIQAYVLYCRWTYRGAVAFREHVSDLLHEVFQLHSAVNDELLDLALSEIDYGDRVKNVRDQAQDVFAEDYYYKHGIAYCEVHRSDGDGGERDPLKIMLNVSNPPPELLLYKLVKRRNSLVLSSASIRVHSPLTNLNLDWLLRKFREDLPAGPDVVHEVIDLDDPARATLYQAKRQAMDALFNARRWQARPLNVHIFTPSADTSREDTEYLDGCTALAQQIKMLNKQRIPAIGIVLVNSYEHAREVLRNLARNCTALAIDELYGIHTDVDRPGLSVLETWLQAGEMPRAANGMPGPVRDSMLFDEIERVVSSRMGWLMGGAKLRNGLVVSVYRKIGKGATFRVDLGNVKPSRHGKAYMGADVAVDAANPYLDFNLLAFVEHPRNLVNRYNFRRVSVLAVSIGGREMQEKLSGKLVARGHETIQRALKWSSFGASAVAEVTLQGGGRITRCRTPLPASRHLLMSAKHARLFMLGIENCRPEELLMTPDLGHLRTCCHEYWVSHTILCEDEDNGAAGWVANAYAGHRSADALKAVRDIRMFLARPEHHVLTHNALEKRLSVAFQGDYAPWLKEAAAAALRRSYMATSHDQIERASVQKRPSGIMLNHSEQRLSVITYRQSKPPRRASNDVIMLLKPRELFEIAYPAADELAILAALESLTKDHVARFSVQAAIGYAEFMGPIRQGTHEAGDFYLQLRDVHLLLDVKTTAVDSPRSVALRDEASVRDEVRAKSLRFSEGSGIKLDGFIFANSGWAFQHSWYVDQVPDCGLSVFHMNACTTLRQDKMQIDFSRSLNEIVGHIEHMRVAALRKTT